MPRTTAVLVVVLLVSGCHGSDGDHPTLHSGSRPGSTVSASSATIPWTPLPPTRPHLSSRVLPPRPDPARSALLPPCAGSALELHVTGPDGAAGTTVDPVRITLRPGRAACSLRARPTVTVATVDGHTLGGRPEQWGPPWRGAVPVSHARSAVVYLTWPSACFESSSSARAVARIELRGAAFSLPAGLLASTCDFGGPRRQLGWIGVSRLQPLHPHPARRVGAFDAIRVHAPALLHARPEQPVEFVVTLVTPRAVSLDPCPDYRLGASPGRGQRFGLDCDAVPWRDTRGHPYLPAHRPVRLTLRLGGMGGPVQKFWWQLLAPGSPPMAGGQVSIR